MNGSAIGFLLGVLRRRLLRSVGVVAAATMLGIAVVVALPGDRLRADMADGRPPLIASVSTDTLGVVLQVQRQLAALARGDLGQSTSEARPVTTLLAEALPATLELAGAALLGAIVIGVGLGTWLGWPPEGTTPRGRVVEGLLLVCYTVPDVVLGTLALALLASAWPVFPAGGLTTPRIALFGSAGAQALDRLHHLVLPALVLALTWSAALFRQQRVGLTRLRQAPYIAVARAKGVSARGIRWHHAVRVGSIGTVAMLGLMLPTLVGGAVVIETLFAWPGMGRLMVHAVAVRDAPLLAGGLVCTAVAVAFGSLITDVVVQLLDPRLRDGAAA